LKKTIKKIYEDLLQVKKKESILILCDKKTKPIAEEFFEYGYQYGDHTLCLEIKEGKINGEEPEPEVAKLLLKYDILLLITTKSLSHTNARKKASKKGAKVITMPGITKRILNRCVDIDYTALKTLHEKIHKLMKKAKKVRITTKKGTDLSFKIYNNKVIYKTSMNREGDFHNIPMGEVFVSPKEGTAEGVYVVDASQAGVGKLKKPIKLRVKKGYVSDFDGYSEAKELYTMLMKVGDKGAFNIAEFGMGTNPKAKVTGNILEDEKVMGTCHIAVGNNYSFGGKVNVPIHLDGIIKKPTIYFGRKMIMKEGKFLI